MKIGPYDVEALLDGRFGLDGGAMFGIVPRPLWERTNPPDEANRIELAARCLLIRGGGRCILVETGLGDKFDDKRAEIFKVRRPGGGLVGALERRGIVPGDVTDVVLTHLHFDHCGGTSRRENGRLVLTFPRAVHHLQRRHWEWATAPSLKDAGSFRAEDFAPLADSPDLNLLAGEGELFEGIHLRVVDGHTTGLQLVRIEGPEATLLFCADLVPTRAHLRWPYIMAYDNRPLTTLEEKRELLPRAAAAGWIVAFGHDPDCAAALLAQEEEDRVVVARELAL